jgi:hypothetical protein
MTRATVSADGETITIHIPLTFQKRGGRKMLVTPDGAEWAPRPRVDNAWSRRWRGRSGGGRCWTPACMRRLRAWPRANSINATYVSRILRLTLLAPAIVEAILDGRQPAELQLEDLLAGFSMDWEGQRSGLGV